MITLEMVSLAIVILFQVLSTTHAAHMENLAHSNETKAKHEDPPVEAVVYDEEPFHIDLSNLKNNMTAVIPANSKPASNSTVIKQDTIDNSDAGIPIAPKNNKDNILDSGAMLRGFYVFLGLSLVTVFYFLYKTYRLRSGSQPPTQVRKYGVLTRRGDVEMLPLPLDDEDEDDTVFDLGNHSTDQQNNRGVFVHS